jgi:hypothetical protein
LCQPSGKGDFPLGFHNYQTAFKFFESKENQWVMADGIVSITDNSQFTKSLCRDATFPS